MNIKRRGVSKPRSETEPKKHWADGLEAKEKPELPDEGLLKDAALSPAHMRWFARAASETEGSVTDVPLSVMDKLKFVRSSYDENNPQEQFYRDRIKNPLTAIRAMCIICRGSRKSVLECASVTCELWPYRLGRSPYRGVKL